MRSSTVSSRRWAACLVRDPATDAPSGLRAKNLNRVGSRYPGKNAIDGTVTRRRACGPMGGPIATRMQNISYAGYRFPPEIIQQAIWLYVRPVCAEL